MKKRELGISFYNLTRRITTRSGIKNPVGADLSTLLDRLYKEFKKSNAVKASVKKGSVLLEMIDLEHDAQQNEYHLLLSLADSDIADFAFKDVNTKQSHQSNKTQNDGIDKSTHILIKIKNADHALMIATQGTGISISRLERFLNFATGLMSRNRKNPDLFEQPHPSDEAGKTYKVRYCFDCTAYLDTTLNEALSGGTLDGVTLFKYEKNPKFDEEGKLEKIATSMKLQAVDPHSITVGALQIALKSAKENYEKATVSFTDKAGNSSRKTFEINHLEEAFVRKERLKFDTDLMQTYTSISPSIIAEMRKHL